MNTKEQLIAIINRNGDVNNPDTPRPLVSLEEFFEGNDDLDSIAAKIESLPGIQEFYSILKRIRGRTSVQDVLVEIAQHEHESKWPQSDTVYILSSAPMTVIEQWAIPLGPDDIFTGWPVEWATEKKALAPGMEVYGLWWN